MHGDDALIDLIYGALLGETSWQDFLGKLSRTLPGGGSTLFFHDANRRKGAFSLSGGIEPSALDAYASYFSSINPWMTKAAVRPVGRGVVAEQMLPRAEFVRTEYYNDFARKNGMESAVGVTIIRDRGVSFMLSTVTSRADPDSNMAEAERLTRLAPHLRRTFEYYSRAPHDRTVTDVAEAALSVLDIGLLMLGDGGRVRTMTPAAARMMEEGVGLSVSATGKLRSSKAAVDEVITAMTDRTLERPHVSDVVAAGSRGPVRLTFIRVGKDKAAAFFEGPTVLVLIDPAHPPRSNAQAVGPAFDLTAAEHRIFAGIAAGQTLREIADNAGISYQTARVQLRRVFTKTGVNRQADLVRLAERFGFALAS
ncbi:helix-turn-helix transcriptional regulator [Mesorhizobium sp. BAC0120]|uniref:helix-turn-helix transcriptional regulator n=1 Tax=Mesorhizobium sp. BAC0120 TaxID=3090670 RepID=UPI00298C977B|nr:helix-turn-helix transcriptional regulator [Mesorhizobium sp. BAC0120]MDW6023101.1 helix-turn-helix transcriptional regulator [Mesorhizobium sp. BAC0120]